MSITADAHRLITLSLGKIASSRQQRGGINLHKNLLVASVLHKARTAYMMENFQTMMANRKSQAEANTGHSTEVKNAVTKEVVTQERCETPKPMDVCERTVERDQVSDSRAGNSSKVSNSTELREDKENLSPVCENSQKSNKDITKCENTLSSRLSARSCSITDISKTDGSQSVLSDKRESVDNTRNYVSRQTGPCVRCGDKRRRSMRDTDSDTGLPKKPRMDNDITACESSSDSAVELMQTETSQISSLVTIFNSGFGGLNGKVNSDSSSGHVGVYSHSGHSYHSLTDLSCGTEVKDSVTMPTVIALAV